jgi:hypothetical protein
MRKQAHPRWSAWKSPETDGTFPKNDLLGTVAQVSITVVALSGVAGVLGCAWSWVRTYRRAGSRNVRHTLGCDCGGSNDSQIRAPTDQLVSTTKASIAMAASPMPKMAPAKKNIHRVSSRSWLVPFIDDPMASRLGNYMRQALSAV